MTDALPPLRPGDAITRWAMAAPDARLFPGTARPMPDRVDYRFVNGWVDTGDLPCREALLAARGENDRRPETCPTADFHSIHLCGDSPDADFSQFCHRPMLIRHLLRCRIAGEGTARFTLATCGGVRLWLGDTLVARFQPFTRNTRASRDITLPLTGAAQTLTVELEDLHERDTTCFVSLTLRSGTGVRCGLPGGLALGDIAPVLTAMDSLRTDRVFYTGGPVRLVCDAAPEAPLALKVERIAPFPRGGIAGLAQAAGGSVDISAKSPEATLCTSETAPQGAVSITVAAAVGAGQIRRQLGTTVLARVTPLHQPDLAARKTAALAAIRAEAAFDPSVALALLAAGQASERANDIIAHGLTTIEQRHDCCDFTLLPLLRILRDHGALLPAPLAQRLRAAVLGFRYWLDSPGNDVMWFWSENHVACFHIAQMIAGGLFPDETFANSGKTGTALRADATARLHRWFDAIEAHGLGEWNSAAYYPIDLLALLTLHDMGDDPALQVRAVALMDTIFVMTGLHTTGGVPAGSQGRAYEKELLAAHGTELGSVAAVAFGGDLVPGFDRAAALFSLSDYAPPPLAAALARPDKGETITARYTQGLDHLGRLTLFKSADVQLSTVSDHKTGQPGHQQHVIDVQCAAHPMARLWINHPGELKEWGERRPSLLAGNGQLPRVMQAGALAGLIYRLPPDAIPFTQMFAPEQGFDGITESGDWIILQSGAARIAVWCSAPRAPVTRGLYRGSLWRADGPQTAWVVAVGDATLPDRLDRPRFDGSTLAARLGGTTLTLPFDGPALVNGAPDGFAPLSPVPHLGRDGTPLAPWTTWQGPPAAV